MRWLNSPKIAVVFLSAFVMPAWAQTTPDPQTRTFPWEGEVTGTNVYVRSGPGSNYYPTSKVGPGTRVLVTGEQFGWYQIVPLRDSFCYVESTLVDRPAGSKTGTITQDKVYVRAGSELERRKTSIRTVLNKGATVEILGEADGFFKIVPPRDATLFISAQYVQFVPLRLRSGLLEKYMAGGPMPRFDQPIATPQAGDKAAPSAATTPPAAQSGTAVPKPVVTEPDPNVVTDATDSEDRPPQQGMVVPKPVDESGEPIDTDASSIVTVDENRTPVTDAASASEMGKTKPPPEPASGGPGRYDAMLQILETEMQTELRRPLIEQSLTSLRDRYQPIADQTDEYVPAAIAKIRLRQLTDRIALQASRAQLVSETSEVVAFRAKKEDERRNIDKYVKRMLPSVDEFDLHGELRRSFAFAPEKRRYRLIDPARNTTLAYVDVPREIEPGVERMVGRLVGVKAAGREYSTAARMTIVVAAKIVDLTPPQDATKPLPAQNTGPAEANTPERATAEPVGPAAGNGQVGVAADDSGGRE